MRLLKCDDDGKIRLEGPFDPHNIPPYAILSHTWGDQEVVFEDMMRDDKGRSKEGYFKIEMCVKQAKEHGLDYSWVDTCCIDKSSSAELQTAIISMFRWYSDAKRCYVFMSDVPSSADDRSFQHSRWFTRGWTLQELLAPKSVEFFDREWNLIGNKSDAKIEAAICQITKIPALALSGNTHLSRFSVDERMRWLGGRETKLVEDRAYCLLGILGIFTYILYGEREEAMVRVRKEAQQRQTAAHMSIGKRTLSWLFAESRELLPAGAISGSAPCLVEFNGDLVAMWRARENPSGIPFPFFKDYTLWWATLKRNEQGEIFPGYPKPVHPAAQSSERPAIAAMQNQLVAAWKGVNHTSLYYSTLHHVTGKWAQPAQIPNYATSSTGVSLASLEPGDSRSVCALWKGDDNQLYLSTYDGVSWWPPKRLPWADTDVNPALAAYDGKLIIAWKQSRAEKLYWMSLDTDGNHWIERPQEIDRHHGQSNLGPALAVVDGTLCAAWRATGGPDDVRLSTWHRQINGFADSQFVFNSGSRCAPTLASWGDKLVLAWRGNDWEQRMWWRNGELQDVMSDKTAEASP